MSLSNYSNAQDSTYIKKKYEKFEYMIKMRDGKKLYTAVFVPRDKTKKYPILLNRTPYSCQPYGKNAYWQQIGPGFSKKYVDEGFIFVKQDVRGRFLSEGEYEDIRPHLPTKKGKEFDEASDTYDAVDWLVKNIKECNGNVGVYGISYPGFYASCAALANHPAIKAVSPQAPVTNWFLGDDVHHNGAFFLFDDFTFDYVFGKPRPKPTTVWEKGFKYPTSDAYNFFLKLGTLQNITRTYMDSLKFWGEEMNHPNYDKFWQDRDIRKHFKNITCAVLTVGGLYDAEDCWGGFETYKWIENLSPKTNNKIIEGPWFHGGWSRSEGNYFGDIKFGSNTSIYYCDSIEFPFFMQHLKGAKDANLAEATVFDIGADPVEHGLRTICIRQSDDRDGARIIDGGAHVGDRLLRVALVVEEIELEPMPGDAALLVDPQLLLAGKLAGRSEVARVEAGLRLGVDQQLDRDRRL